MTCKQDYVPRARIQFTVGKPDSYNSLLIQEEKVQLPSDGDGQLIVNIPHIIEDTAELYLLGGASPLPRGIFDDQASYDVVYDQPNDTGFLTVNFLNGSAGFQNNQTFILTFAYYIKTS